MRTWLSRGLLHRDPRSLAGPVLCGLFHLDSPDRRMTATTAAALGQKRLLFFLSYLFTFKRSLIAEMCFL